MKALSVKQPWANLIADGYKTIEVRTWSTNYRGELLIVSSKTPRISPAGYAVAIVTLADCRAATPADEFAAHCRIYTGQKAWILKDIRKIRPFQVRGMPGIYSVDNEVIFSKMG